jgi:hypothetical protein
MGPGSPGPKDCVIYDRKGSSEKIMFNPWIFGLEAIQQGWQAQSALAFRLMRSFAGGVADKITSHDLIPDTVTVDIKVQREVAPIADVRKAPAPITEEQQALAAIANVRRRKAPKALRASTGTSRVKARSVSKRAAAARQNSALKAVRRSQRKPQ